MSEEVLPPSPPTTEALHLPESPGLDSQQVQALLSRLRNNIETVVLGKSNVIELALITLLAEGHLLIEDVPGVGKTLMAKALARSLAASFHRIQFTPDLLPSDLIGTNIYRRSTEEFVFQPGPLFANVILADEINRATPRTQSALLEVMSDRQISLDGQTHTLGPLFLVLATQNPFEFEGTYPLPESQLDRFLIRTTVGYPDRAVEQSILQQHTQGEPVDTLAPVLSISEVRQLQASTRQVKVTEAVAGYLLDLIHASREHSLIAVGASTRAALGYYRACQARALLADRPFVVPDDVQALAEPVLAHRLLTRQWRGEGQSQSTAMVIQELIEKVPVPT